MSDDEPEMPEVEFYTLPSTDDVEYWERNIAAGLNQPIPLVAVNGDHLDVDSWEPINLATLTDRERVKPTLGSTGIAYPEKRHVFSGPQESAKTLAAYAIGLELVRQGDHIIVIDFEMGQWDARDRLRELGATPDDFTRIHYLEPSEPATQERVARLIVLNPQLVIIDAAAGAYDNQGLDDNKRADVEKFTRLYVRDFWRANIATIVLDHVVKNTETRGKYAIGSERKVGGTDVHLGFEVVTPISRGKTGIYKITTHKDRGGWLQRGRLADLHLSSDPDTHNITWEFKEAEHADPSEPFRPTVLMEHVSAYLQKQAEPVTFTTVKSDVKGEDKFIAVALERLIEEGYVSETPGTRNARLVTHSRLFSKEEPHGHKDAGVQAASDKTTSDKKAEETASGPVSTPNPTAQTDSSHALRSPAEPLPAGDTVTPAPASISAGVAGDEQTTKADAGVDVHDPAVQALLDPDDGIPF